MKHRGIGAYKKAQKAAKTAMSPHALTMQVYKEMKKNLELCDFAFDHRKKLTFNRFLEKKGVALAKVCRYVTFMINAANRDSDPETLELYDRMYHYILEHALNANKDLDHESVKRALYMTNELIEIWDSIPQEYR